MINRQKGNFTIVLNSVVNNKDLSAKALGIYVHLESKADGWQFYEAEIIKSFKDGKDSIRSGIKELIDAKLLIKYQDRNGGKFGVTKWILNPTIDDLRLYDTTVDGKPANGKAVNGKADDGKPATNNTNTKKTKSKKTKSIQKKEEEKKVYLKTPELNNLFLEYLELRKKNKLSNSETVIKRLINKLKSYYEKGLSVEEAITNAITGNWKDFYEPKPQQNHPQSFKEKELEHTSNVVETVMSGFNPFDPSNYMHQSEDSALDAEVIEG